MPGLFKHLLFLLPHMTMNTMKMEAAISCDTLGIICRNKLRRIAEHLKNQIYAGIYCVCVSRKQLSA